MCNYKYIDNVLCVNGTYIWVLSDMCDCDIIINDKLVVPTLDNILYNIHYQLNIVIVISQSLSS